MELGASKRLQESQSQAMSMLNRVRLGEEITDDDVNKLLSLRLDVMKQKHGSDVVREIEDKAMYLFYRNVKRIRHNLERLIAKATPDNPVAIIKSQSSGTVRAKGFKSHFDSDIPSSALLCVDCMVALNSRNFKPLWGLHNGACGIVKELVFADTHNPNHGDMPLYVVVEFPLYCGPIWDIDNTKVSVAIDFDFASSSKTHRLPSNPSAGSYTNGGFCMCFRLLFPALLPPYSCVRPNDPQVPGSNGWSGRPW
jgi:hypothetical protein